MTLFSGDELLRMVDAASVVTVNDYETHLLAERTGLALTTIAQRVDALVVTMGAEGSLIHTGGHTLRIGVAHVDSSSIRPVAATRIAPDCCTRWQMAGTGSVPASSRRRSAR